MQGDRLQWVVIGGLLTVTAVSALTLRETAAVGASVRQPSPPKEPRMQTLTEVVTVTSDPTRKVTVTTTRNDNETDAAFMARHSALVAAVKAG